MNPSIRCKPKIPRVFIAGVLACFALFPSAQAVNPPPDGGYPSGNTAEGQNALFTLTTGQFNTAVGLFSLRSNTNASFNTAIGAGTLFVNTANQNTAIGTGALLSNTSGSLNTAIGVFSLVSNATGSANTAIGDNTLFGNTTGSGNTAVGANALSFNTTGAFNIALGGAAGQNVTTANDVICIGSSGANVSNSCYIDNIYGTAIDPATTLAVGMDASQRLGTAVSSRRFKRDIQPMENASEAILALKPVTFHYKSDVKSTPCFGLVAEDVEKVNPHLIARDKNGEPLSVRYEQINAMLLNEFLKEHRKNREQEATIAQLKKEIETVVARLKEHDSKIRRVSAQIELSQAVEQTALNSP